MILVPVLSLLLFASFIVYSFFEYQQSNRNINLLRADYVPVMELVNDNIRLLEKLRDRFKDVVLASELLWLDDTVTIKNQVQANFLALEKYPDIVKQQSLFQSQKDFEHYYASASKLARRLVTDGALWFIAKMIMIIHLRAFPIAVMQVTKARDCPKELIIIF